MLLNLARVAYPLDGQNVSLKCAGIWEECIYHVDCGENVPRYVSVWLAYWNFRLSIG